jgi:hypothetical protein
MLYEDRSARISILAGRHPPRPDTLKQTDHSALSIKPLANGAGHTFFEQAVLQGQVGHDLLQCGGLTTKILYLAGRRRTRRVTGQPALAGLQELLGPAVIHRGGDALAAAELGDVLLAAQPLQHDADFLFRRVLPARLTPNVLQHLFCRRFGRPGFLFHLRSLRLR